jgi:hypothetical protein
LAVVAGKGARDGAGNGYGEKSQGLSCALWFVLQKSVENRGKVGAGLGGGGFGSSSSAKGGGSPGQQGEITVRFYGFGSPRGEGRRLAKKTTIF